MNYLITGGAGFIGSNFIRILLKEQPDAKITCLDSLSYAGTEACIEELKVLGGKRFNFIKGNICWRTLVEELINKNDVIINFAAESHVDRSIKDDSLFIKSNIEGVHTILQSLTVCGKDKRFVQVSTDEVYGSLEFPKDAREDSPLNPTSPYSASKAAADLLVNSYVKTHKINAVITRSTNNYGPWQHPEKMIPKLITCVLQKKSFPLYDGGSQVRDWIYVDDNCRGILEIAMSPHTGIFNIGVAPWEEVSNLNIICDILDMMNAPKYLLDPFHTRKGHDERYSVSTKRIRSLTKWSPTTSLRDGLKSTINFYNTHTEWWKKLTYDSF